MHQVCALHTNDKREENKKNKQVNAQELAHFYHGISEAHNYMRSDIGQVYMCV